jgi:hypothetical protein
MWDNDALWEFDVDVSSPFGLLEIDAGGSHLGACWRFDFRLLCGDNVPWMRFFTRVRNFTKKMRRRSSSR